MAAKLLPLQRPKPREGQGEPGGGTSDHSVGSRPVPGTVSLGSRRSSEAVWVALPPASCLLGTRALPGARPGPGAATTEASEPPVAL